jgi:UDP-glucose 4-epimerase
LVYVLQELQKMTEANFILVHLALFTVKPKMPITEDARFKKSDPYGNTKQIAEQTLKYLT